jgi:A/G-specific adenine glycosylase
MSGMASHRGTISERRALLDWYDERRRDLPWRRRSDPYAIWVSEIMLQQTRVETVLPYYERFLERFPTVASLASAKTEEVLALWSGLGYYRRARLMHAAACKIVDEGGTFPRTLEGLRALPGVGEYTAAAVGSIGFGLVQPTIDGNVKRVVGRLLALEVEPNKATKEIRARAVDILDSERPGDCNQALMEIGATICAARQPNCHACPLESGCLAAQSGAPESYPAKGPAAKRQHRRRLIALVRRGEKYLLFKRPEDSKLLAGIWEFPWVDDDGVAGAEEGLAGRYGGRWSLGAQYGSIRHAITFRSFEVSVRGAALSEGLDLAEGREAAWLKEDEISEKPHSSLVRKVFDKLGGNRDQGGA